MLKTLLYIYWIIFLQNIRINFVWICHFSAKVPAFQLSYEVWIYILVYVFFFSIWWFLLLLPPQPQHNQLSWTDTDLNWSTKCLSGSCLNPLQQLGVSLFKSVCLCVQSWVERAGRQALLSDTLDLSELFHPDTFLNALRQETAR